MSGECYSARNLRADQITSAEGSKTVDKSNSKSGPENELENTHQLLEYESTVSTAENKCNELTGQLEQIKKFYQNHCETICERKKICPSALQQKIGSSVGSFGNQTSVSGLIKQTKKLRQNSQAITTDTSGASLRIINNILSGITKPIKLENFAHKESDKSCIAEDVETQCIEQLFGVEGVKINTKSNTKAKTKSNTRKSKSKVSTKTSVMNFKKSKRPSMKLLSEKKQNKISDAQIRKPGVSLFRAKSRKAPPKEGVTKEMYTPCSKRTNANSDLVEIYHNIAAKECKSSDSDMTRKKSLRITPQTEMGTNLVPPLTIDTNENQKSVVSCIYRNYTLPTISSRMKRVAKYYMHSFNLKTIPFCLSTSTSASHNIGINIQQVMSMVKGKQAITKLSPTLAYNIGLAAGKKDDDLLLPFTASSVVSRNLHSQCPLTKSTFNYQNLQEMAKNIPQEIAEEPEDNEGTNSPETQSVIITGPSGDVKVKNRRQTVWTAHPDEKKCTCVTPKGNSFQQIVNKFNGTRTVSRYKQISHNPSMSPVKFQEQKPERRGAGEACRKPSGTPLLHKEKKLKEVLEKLHDEFAKLTETYDSVAQKTEQDVSDPQALKELENLDKELSSKEEEIMMVMSLYNEVLALKKQVQILKDRTSKENISVGDQSKATKATGLLNNLLDRVHHFQTHYKRR